MHHKPIYKGSFQEENNMQNIKKKISAAILGGILVLNALLLCACKGVIAAEETGVTVENALGYAVNELYIYPNNTVDWGNNLLTTPMEQSGAVLTYLSALTGGNRDGTFNLQLIDSDGDTYSFNNVQIADGDALTLRGKNRQGCRECHGCCRSNTRLQAEKQSAPTDWQDPACRKYHSVAPRLRLLRPDTSLRLTSGKLVSAVGIIA